MREFLTSVDPHWFWLSLAVVLGSAEMVAPGFFLIWLGIAAGITGVLAWLLPISFFLEIGIFAALSIVAVYAARRYLKANPIESTDPLLNDRGGRLVGEIVTVVESFESGQGRVRVGDSVWSAKNSSGATDFTSGSRLRVAGIDRGVLLVEPLV